MKNHSKLILLPFMAILLATMVQCKKEEIGDLATLSTLAVTNITEKTAQSGGEITHDGGSEISSRGIVWGRDPKPTLAQNHGIAEDGSGSEIFGISLNDLVHNMVYYVRAYATNQAGTVYGEEQQFITLEGSSPYPPDTFTEVVEVYNPATGKTWMDRNLGASRAATSKDDAEASGHLYQWGRPADGHQLRTSGITSTRSTSNSPGHNQFIRALLKPNDWRDPQSPHLWQGANGTNNPCPTGFRLPTYDEWNEEVLSWSSNDSNGAFASPLKLPEASHRNYSNGQLNPTGGGFYWTSTISENNSWAAGFSISNARMGVWYRALGFSVRCIKELSVSQKDEGVRK